MSELFKSDKSDISFLNVAMMWFPVLSLGYGNRLGVWTQGCHRRCLDCISPEFQSFNGGKPCTAKDILGIVPDGEIPDGLTISGGEPFEQSEALLNLIKAYRSSFQGDILIYTGYSLNELKAMNNSNINSVLDLIDVLIDGAYRPEDNNGLGLRGSTNQSIHVFRYKERYIDAEIRKRDLQCIFWEESMCFIGIPPL